MAYNVSSAFREQLYSGESEFRAILTIGENTIDNDQIASISISSPIIDDSKKVFYVGTFISQKITIKFKNMDGIDVHSGDNVDLSIGQYVNNEWVDVPIGKFLVDDLAENYFEKCEISCLDYAVKFKPNIDYSECFTEKIVDGKVVKSATIETILKYICNEVNVQLGSYPTINNDIEIGTYDSTVSGKQWISYIAEIKGCNAKMDRQGRLTLQPLKQSSNVPINALESASFELGEKYKISQVVYFDALRNYTFGNDKENTLYIRQENPFINDENVIKEIYKSIINEQRSETEATDFDLYNTDEFDLSANKMYGETSQEGNNKYQMLMNTNQNNGYNYWSEYSTYDKETRTLTRSTTDTSETFIVHRLNNNIIKNNTTYTLSCFVKQNGKVRDVDFFMYGISGGAVGIRNKTFSDIGTNWVKKTWTFTSDASANYTNAIVRFDNNGSTTSGQEAILYVKDVMLEKGSVAHDYEDYPTSPDNPHKVNTVTGRNVVNITGKNLFNISLYDGSDKTGSATVSNDGEILTFTSSNNDAYTPSLWQYADFYEHRKMAMEVNPSTQYTFSFDVDSTPNGIIYIYEGDKNYQGIGQAGTIDYNSTTKTITFTTSANTYYLMFRFVLWSATTINISNIQLELGDTKTEYEPYKSQEHEIDLGKNLLDIDTIIPNMINTMSYASGTLVYDKDTRTLTMTNANNDTYLPAIFGDANNKPRCNISVKKNTYYTLHFDIDQPLSTMKNSIMGLNKSTDKYKYISDGFLQSNTITFNTGDYDTIIFRIGSTATTGTITHFSNFQLEEGSIATNYAPYHEPIELCKIGDYTDYITKNTGANIFKPTLTCEGTIIVSPNCTPALIDDEYILTATGSDMYFSQVVNFGIDYVDYIGPLYETNNAEKIYFYCTNPLINKNYITWYDENKTSLGYEGGVGNNNKTFNVPSNAKYFTVRFGYGSATSGITYRTRVMVSYTPITDYEPYGKDEWYEYHNIGKWFLTGASDENWALNMEETNVFQFVNKNFANNTAIYDTNSLVMSNYFKYKRGNPTSSTNEDYIWQFQRMLVVDIRKTLVSSLNDFKTWLSTHNTEVWYRLATPEIRKITYQPLIDQLNAIEKMKSYEGKTYITSRGTEENSPIDIKYYINTDFELWSLKTHNYGDFTLDAWDNINYELGDKNYLTLNNNTINYEMTIMGDVTTKIPTKQQEVTTNVVGGDDSVNIKKIKTEVDNLNGTATILAEKTDNNSDQISQLRVDINAIQNLFTLTGGRNNVRNSAFLLTDEVWNFTNNGSNPYHTTFGKSYDISLAGKTVSISEIKLQDTIAKTNSDNITGIKNDGTRYNLSFYYKQDADTTTTIKLYDTNNSSVKAFDDIIITGEKEFRSYNISFVPTSTNYTLEIITSTTSSTGAFYLYDLMLNSGDRQPWSPAPDEVYSTTLTMSRLGLKVYSVGDGTITLLGSDGLVSYETTDGQTLGRLVSKRTVNGDLTKSNTSELIGLVPDIVAFEEGTDKRRWVDTSIELNGKLHKITYLETGE